MGKRTELGMSVCSSNKTILVGIRGRDQNGWKKAEHAPISKKLVELVDPDEPTSFLEYIWDALNVNANRTKT